MRKTALLLFAALPTLAGEHALLRSGFRIHVQSHEKVGDLIRLHTATGSLEMPAAEVVGFEAEEPAEKPASAPTPVAADPAPVRKTPRELVHEAAITQGLRPEFVRSVAAVESGFRQSAVSPKGAIGLMQLMPGTAAELGADPRNAEQNAHAGARYLRQLLDKYKDRPDGVRLAIAAYNAGPGAVDRHGRIPPYRETQAYVEKVVARYLEQIRSKPAQPVSGT